MIKGGVKIGGVADEAGRRKLCAAFYFFSSLHNKRISIIFFGQMQENQLDLGCVVYFEHVNIGITDQGTFKNARKRQALTSH